MDIHLTYQSLINSEGYENIYNITFSDVVGNGDDQEARDLREAIRRSRYDNSAAVSSSAEDSDYEYVNNNNRQRRDTTDDPVNEQRRRAREASFQISYVTHQWNEMYQSGSCKCSDFLGPQLILETEWLMTLKWTMLIVRLLDNLINEYTFDRIFADKTKCKSLYHNNVATVD